MGKRSKAKKRRAAHRRGGDRPRKRPPRYSAGELALAALGALLILFFLGMLVSSLL